MNNVFLLQAVTEEAHLMKNFKKERVVKIMISKRTARTLLTLVWKNMRDCANN